MVTNKSTDMDWVWAFIIAFVTVVILHQPGLSVQNAVIGSRPFSFIEMSLLKFLVGAVNSSVIVGICSVFLRHRPSRSMVWGAVVTQILWLEIEWGLSIGATNIEELSIRFAEELGTITAGIVVLACVRLWSSDSRGRS
jgi:hypothetical protein